MRVFSVVRPPTNCPVLRRIQDMDRFAEIKELTSGIAVACKSLTRTYHDL